MTDLNKTAGGRSDANASEWLAERKRQCPARGDIYCNAYSKETGWLQVMHSPQCDECLALGGIEGGKDYRKKFALLTIDSLLRKGRSLPKRVREGMKTNFGIEPPAETSHAEEWLRHNPCGHKRLIHRLGRTNAERLIESITGKSDKRIVVVGNGPSATRHKLGEIIDSYDIVVRFNDFQIEKYAPYVGTRTDLFVTFVSGVSRSKIGDLPGDIPRSVQQILVTWSREPLSDHTDFVQRLNAQVPTSLISSDTWNTCYRELRKYSKGGILPSSGVQAISHLLQLHRRVCIIGFDHFRNRKAINNRIPGHHYFPDNRMCGLHSFEAEKAWFAARIKTGQVVPLEMLHAPCV